MKSAADVVDELLEGKHGELTSSAPRELAVTAVIMDRAARSKARPFLHEQVPPSALRKVIDDTLGGSEAWDVRDIILEALRHEEPSDDTFVRGIEALIAKAWREGVLHGLRLDN